MHLISGHHIGYPHRTVLLEHTYWFNFLFKYSPLSFTLRHDRTARFRNPLFKTKIISSLSTWFNKKAGNLDKHRTHISNENNLFKTLVGPRRVRTLLSAVALKSWISKFWFLFLLLLFKTLYTLSLIESKWP